MAVTNPSPSVAVGSRNPVKIKAVSQGFAKVWPESPWRVKGYDVPSGISSQPLSDLESIAGARNRARAVLAQSSATYGVGVEGGLQPIGDLWFDCGWVVIINRQGIEGLGSTARIITPPKMMALIHQGQELGQAVDHFFQQENSKQADGHFGLMTNKAITRTSGYVDGVVMALVRFLHPHLF